MIMGPELRKVSVCRAGHVMVLHCCPCADRNSVFVGVSFLPRSSSAIKCVMTKESNLSWEMMNYMFHWFCVNNRARNYIIFEVVFDVKMDVLFFVDFLPDTACWSDKALNQKICLPKITLDSMWNLGKNRPTQLNRKNKQQKQSKQTKTYT